jgi:hypothetical protein
MVFHYHDGYSCDGLYHTPAVSRIICLSKVTVNRGLALAKSRFHLKSQPISDTPHHACPIADFRLPE